MNKPVDAPLAGVDLGLAWRNSFAALDTSFYTPLAPTPLPAPYWVGVSHAVARDIGLQENWLQSPEGLAAFSW